MRPATRKADASAAASAATTHGRQRVTIVTGDLMLSCQSDEDTTDSGDVCCLPSASGKRGFPEADSDYSGLLPRHRLGGVRAGHWARPDGGRGSSSSDSAPSALLSLSNSQQRKQQQQEQLQQLLDANNSGAGIDMLNMPSSAETVARQKSWMQIYFRYRVQWYQAKPFLEKMSREDAYLPHNLNLWTRYVKVSLHRKVPFINAVRAFRNRIRVPGVQMRYTLNAFHHKTTERAAKQPGPLHPTSLPQFRCPDDLPEFRKLAVAVTNVFVTTDDTYFDEFWRECGAN